MEPQSPSPAPPLAIPRSLFVFSLLYGGLAVLAGVLGTKLASLGHWPMAGDLAVESGIFAFLLLVVLSSAVSELHGQATANRLVRYGFIPLIVSMCLLTFVIHVVPPAPFWSDQDAFARLLGQGARMQFAGLVSYGVSQTLNVQIFSRMAGGRGKLLMFRAWVASLFSQVVDTVLFITISFTGVVDQASGKPMPIGAIMEGQIISKLLLSTIMVPPFIWFFVRLGRKLDS
ncbi:queuosine precursor transporter [Novosphingobium album (ex Liu et al. 2023)]|uniref:Probable queuosine precursor transporter n=1 Tax=Novosphingobium album (ex Liu et al. 2023) TaxID=3031130 RepID=A0ABT5WXE4_9SPHN|nr:queuosine precursor transporter [Novosphingobium album (ex Liu et al. 2023)]MDE8654585.1 queuosine precursor transporter [Novosphingobium album (ex Liu et al. 2023)]